MSNFDKSEADIHSEVLSNQDHHKTNKIYSLIPDLITGWKPKNIKIPAPILIKYKSYLVTQLVRYYRDQPRKIIYMGPRYSNSFVFHEHVSHEYNLRYGVTSDDIPHHLRKDLHFEQDSLQKFRLFDGMNPEVKSNVSFDSHFQSGNLDLVIKAGQNQYNLFLRPDTNTCGHMQWFYFTIKNQTKCKIKINICNNKKAKTLFQRGMKPYIFSKKANQSKGVSWQQGGQQLSYSKLILKEQNEDRIINNQIVKIGYFEGFYNLSFQYQFQYDSDQVSFAYCPPYTFSHLKNVIMQLKKNYNCFENIITQQRFCSSLSGLDIPLLTITDPTIENDDKICVVAIGRLHPGESNGSHAIEGFINYLVSEEARQIRKQAVFKVIPMINPDGVIFGNYRTSLSGKDLNRQFRTKKQELIPEVVQLKKYIKRLKYQGQYKMTYFLDFHGHSLKKNVFFYGPEYDIWSIKYEKSRILPKILASKTEMFRMKSCLFKVANFKRSTARAFMLAYIPFCYTIECSVGIFRDVKQEDHPFTSKKWREVGSKIGESIGQIVAKLVESNNNALKRKQKRLKRDESQPQIALSKQKENQIQEQQTQKTIVHAKSVKYLNPIRNIKKRVIQQKPEKPIEMIKIDEEDCESDHFSEGNSDCQSDDNDLPKVQYDKLKDKIINLIDNFQIQMMGKKKSMMLGQKKERKIMKLKKARQVLQRKKSTQEMLLVPSLKHKLDKIILSQKKISFLNSLNLLESSANYRMKRNDRNTSPINHI